VTDQDIPNARYDPFHAAPPTGYLGSNETPGAAFSFDGRMYVFGGVAPPGPITPHRDGDPQPGNYWFNKTDPSTSGPWDIEFLLAPKLGWCVDVGRLEPHAPSACTSSRYAISAYNLTAATDSACAASARHCSTPAAQPTGCAPTTACPTNPTTPSATSP